MELRNLQALSGVLAPAFFFAEVVYMSLSRPEYSHVYNVISELGETGSDGFRGVHHVHRDGAHDRLL